MSPGGHAVAEDAHTGAVPSGRGEVERIGPNPRREVAVSAAVAQERVVGQVQKPLALILAVLDLGGNKLSFACNKLDFFFNSPGAAS